MKNGKLITLIGLYFLTMTIVNAEPYVGGNLGVGILTVSKDLNYANTSSNLSDANIGFRGGVLFGFNLYPFSRTIFYQKNISKCMPLERFYFSIEGDANYTSGSSSSDIKPWFLTTNASVTAALNYSYDIFLLAKYRSAPNVSWFLGPGISWGNFTASSSSTGGNLGITGSANSWLNGWSIKTGVEIAMTRFIDIVVSYEFSSFNNLSKTESWTRTEPLTGENVSVTHQPKLNAITIGLNIKDFSKAFILNDTPACCETPISYARVSRTKNPPRSETHPLEMVYADKQEEPYFDSYPSDFERGFSDTSYSDKTKQKPVIDIESDMKQYS